MNEPRRRKVVVAAPPRRPPAELRGIRVVVEPDLDPDVTFLHEHGFEDQRAAFDRGEITFVGVHIDADIVIQGTDQTLTSPGLWGVESDLDEDTLDQIIAEEWCALRGVLKAVGVATDQLPLEPSREWIERRT